MHAATDIIRHEHATIAVMLHVLEEMLTRYETGADLPTRDATDMATFFLRFADQLHHAKEERVLFPALAARDPEAILPLEGLLEEHQHGRATLAVLAQAYTQGDRTAYYTALRGYIRLMQIHLHRENDWLLPQLDRLLTPEEQCTLAADCEAVQAAYAGGSTELLTIQQELTGRYLAAQPCAQPDCACQASVP